MLQNRNLILSQLESPSERNELLICETLRVEINLSDTHTETVAEYSSRINGPKAALLYVQKINHQLIK